MIRWRGGAKPWESARGAAHGQHVFRAHIANMARVPEPNDGFLERSATKASSAPGDI
jgi:hypothetical protein